MMRIEKIDNWLMDKWWKNPYRFTQCQNHFRWTFAVHIEMRIHQFARNYWHTLQRTGERKFTNNTNVNVRIQVRARRWFIMAGIIINVVDGICAAVATIAIWNGDTGFFLSEWLKLAAESRELALTG